MQQCNVHFYAFAILLPRTLLCGRHKSAMTHCFANSLKKFYEWKQSTTLPPTPPSFHWATVKPLPASPILRTLPPVCRVIFSWMNAPLNSLRQKRNSKNNNNNNTDVWLQACPSTSLQCGTTSSSKFSEAFVRSVVVASCALHTWVAE